MLNIASILLAVALLLHPLSAERVFAATACSGYSDVTTDDWYCEAVTNMQEQGVLSPMSQFNPAKTANRAEALKVITEASGISGIETAAPFFGISADAWFVNYFFTAYGQQVIKSKNGSMNPEHPITKAEFLIIFMQLFEIEPAASSSCGITGVARSDWLMTDQQTAYLCRAKELGIATKGFGDATMTRAVMMQVLYNAISR